MKTKLLYTALIVMVTAFSVSAQEVEPMRGAVLDFTVNDLPAAKAKLVRNLLEVRLYDTGAFTLIERAMMDQILKEQELSMAGCVDTSCAVKIGKLLSARLIFTGTLDRMGKSTLITVKMIDVEQGSIMSAFTGEVSDDMQLPAAIKTIAGQCAESAAKIVTGRTKKPASYDKWYESLAGRYPRVRIGGGIAMMNDAEMNALYGSGFGVMGDLFIWRWRFEKDNGFDLYTRYTYRKFSMPENVMTSSAGIKYGIVSPGTLQLHSADLFMRGVYGGNFLMERWDVYAAAGLRSLYGTSLAKNGKSESYMSLGVAGAVGIEMSLFSAAGLFVEYMNGYTPMGARNVDGHQVWGGVTWRTGL